MNFTVKRHKIALLMGTSHVTGYAHALFSRSEEERADQAAVRKWAGDIVKMFEKAEVEAKRRLARAA